jgi:sensor histidine kinase YesM
VRFGDRLTVIVRIEAGTDRCLVPHFLLQPLVENALQHGIGSRAGNATVDISAIRAHDMLEIRVVDDGRGIAQDEDAQELTEGVGLSNSRRRLATLYGKHQSLTLSNAPGRGLCVTVTLPFRPAPEVPQAESHARSTASAVPSVTTTAHV